jgi:hypothetical protein
MPDKLERKDRESPTRGEQRMESPTKRPRLGGIPNHLGLDRTIFSASTATYADSSTLTSPPPDSGPVELKTVTPDKSKRLDRSKNGQEDADNVNLSRAMDAESEASFDLSNAPELGGLPDKMAQFSREEEVDELEDSFDLSNAPELGGGYQAK